MVSTIRKAIESGAADVKEGRGQLYPPDLFDAVSNSVMNTMALDIFPRWPPRAAAQSARYHGRTVSNDLAPALSSISRFVESDEYKALRALKSDNRRVVGIRDFDIFRFLGAGGFGMVLLAQQRESKRFYAVKVIDKRILISQNQTHSIFREKEVLASVEHPFIVPLRFAFQTEDHLCFVLDYIAGGNMYSDLSRGPYVHSRAVFYAAQTVLATHHLHELDILYRDLKVGGVNPPIGPRLAPPDVRPSVVTAGQRAADARRLHQARGHGRSARHCREWGHQQRRDILLRQDREGWGAADAKAADDHHWHARLPRARGVRARLRQGG